MNVIYDKEKMLVPIKIWATNLEQKALDQAIMAANLPCVFSHVAVMADGHAGFGVPIGSVLALKGAICPNAVGVDIGCGVYALNTGIHISKIDVESLMKEISQNIPVGEGKIRKENDKWFEKYKFSVNDSLNPLHLGTLGGGNHFIELQIDKDGNSWFMIHSGSRGPGAKIATEYHKKAVNLCKKYYTKLPTESLAFLIEDSQEGQDYILALAQAENFAEYNRQMMMSICCDILKSRVSGFEELFSVNIHHNYAEKENHFGENVWVHRKGATLARKETVGAIPGSMCSYSYIVEGKGNKESFNSCSHGAGRNFSRTEAKRRIKEGIDPSQETQLGKVKLFGVNEAHDELGSAYKNIDEVMENQKDLVQTKVQLFPVAVLKG